MKRNVLFEDNHLLVVNKPTGILTQGDSTGDKTILDFYKEYIKEKYDKPGAVFLAPAHRLDRPVSGCLILCRTSKAASRMTELFKNNDIKKTYLALTNNAPSILEGHLEQYLLKDEITNRTKVVKSQSNGAKLAVLDYELIGAENELKLIKVNPSSGRSHQIRAQLSHLKCPILGDVKYGGRKVGEDEGYIFLHCYKMQFVHPVTKETVTVKAGTPQHRYWDQLKSLISMV